MTFWCCPLQCLWTFLRRPCSPRVLNKKYVPDLHWYQWQPKVMCTLSILFWDVIEWKPSLSAQNNVWFLILTIKKKKIIRRMMALFHEMKKLFLISLYTIWHSLNSLPGHLICVVQIAWQPVWRFQSNNIGNVRARVSGLSLAHAWRL